MLLVELPLFARSGLGVGIAINTIMSSGTILSCLFISVTTQKTLTASLENLLPSAILCKLGVVHCLQQDPRHPGVTGGYLVTLSHSWDQFHIIEVDPTN